MEKRKNKKYHDAVKDEVLFYFDILNDNSLINISRFTGIEMDKVRKCIDERYNKVKNGLPTVSTI